MKITFVDRNAVLGTSFLHKAAAESKLAAAAFLLMAAITAGRLELLGFLLAALVLLLLLSGTGMASQALFLVYPLFFGFLFGRILLGYAGVLLALVLLRASCAVFVLLLLITTTPYVRLFTVFNRFLPPVLVDIMFLTYRSFFILAERAGETVTALRLKGGYDLQSFTRSLKNAARILGFTLIHAVDMNEKNFRILLLRGYEGSMMPARQPFRWRFGDVVPVLFSSIFFLLAVLW
jgi:cobalt/nickel transport system permease protein